MSRLFGFFGSEPVNLACNQVADEKRADLAEKKQYISDGWGIGFFRNYASFLFKKATRASGGERITNISELISSQIFISHARQATIGERKEANTQPFRWGNWLFVHQGTINRFRKIKPRILRKLPAAYKKMIKGNTDSEHLFFLFLTMLRGQGAIKKGDIPFESAIEGLRKCYGMIREFCDEAEVEESPTLNFILSNGKYLIASRSGIPMYYLLSDNSFETETEFCSNITGLKYELQNIPDELKFLIVASEKFSDSDNYKLLPDDHLLAIAPSFAINITPL